MRNNKEFAIHGIEVMEHGEAKVIGRCLIGPIFLGDMFDVICSIAPSVDGLPGERRRISNARLQIKKMTAYGVDLPRIDQNMTALLLVCASEFKDVKVNLVLGKSLEV